MDDVHNFKIIDDDDHCTDDSHHPYLDHNPSQAASRLERSATVYVLMAACTPI